MATRTKNKSTPAAEAPTTVLAIKGCDENLSCRGFAYEIGGTYKHEGEVEACRSGFHAIEGHPLEVFSYYAPANNRFAVVECGGRIARHDEDSKIASAEITIKAEINLPELIERAVKYVFDRATWIKGTYATGEGEGVKCDTHGGAATASGTEGAATASGDWGAATASGDQGAATATGERGAATASGWRGAATASGVRGAATASGVWGAATATGERGAATASGTEGAATASGKAASAHASGFEGKTRGIEGTALHLDERDLGGNIVAVWAGIVGRDGIKPMTWYTLRDGKPVEV